MYGTPQNVLLFIWQPYFLPFNHYTWAPSHLAANFRLNHFALKACLSDGRLRHKFCICAIVHVNANADIRLLCMPVVWMSHD